MKHAFTLLAGTELKVCSVVSESIPQSEYIFKMIMEIYTCNTILCPLLQRESDTNDIANCVWYYRVLVMDDPNDIDHSLIGSQIPIYKQIGEVSKENFVYFSIQGKGIFKLTLTSIEGDADMYIAQFPNVPSYEPEHYDLHSASCGEDIIKVPKSFERPFVVGIYGHSNYEVSKFHFRADLLPNVEENDTSYSNFVSEDTIDQRKYTNQDEQVIREDTYVNTNVIRDLKSVVFSFLEIIDMVL